MFEDILTREVLEKDYLIDKINITRIARKYNTSVATVRNYLKYYEIDLIPRSKDLINERFGKLFVIRSSGKDKHQKAKWHCLCDCGSTAEINASSLLRGLTTSCGCHQKEVCRKGGYKEISRSFWRRLIQNAFQRGYAFDITPEFIWELYEKQNRICPLSGLPIVFFPDSNRKYEQTAAIDRIDSNKGYLKDNVQIVNKVINQMKSYFSDEEFISFCNLVAQKNPRSHENSINKASRSILRKI